MRTVIVMLLLAACGGDGTSPVTPSDPPAIVKLLVADPDTGFWLGSGLSLTGLVTGAVNEDGDTVAAPPLAWSVPVGFVRTGEQLTASREARGALTVTGSASAAIQLATVLDLRRRWEASWRCYNSPVSIRGVENPPIGLDSIVVIEVGDSVTYAPKDWRDAHELRMWAHGSSQRFWKDGVVDTAHYVTNRPFVQDTSRLWLGVVKQADHPGLARVSEAPLVYRQDPPGVCSSDWVGPDGRHTTTHDTDGGTAFELRERAP